MYRLDLPEIQTLSLLSLPLVEERTPARVAVYTGSDGPATSAAREVEAVMPGPKVTAEDVSGSRISVPGKTTVMLDAW